MTDYKLVPVEPTAEMLEAGKYALEAGCHASGIYADMLAAAPDVHGEPVGWQRKDRPERMITKLSRRTVAEDEAGVEFIPLYTAPQPAEQQPAPDVVGLLEALEYLMEKYPASRHLQDICSSALAAHRKGGES